LGRGGSAAVGALALLALATLASSRSAAQCDYPFLGSGNAVYLGPSTVWYPTIVQPTNYWSVVAVRPDLGSDWDISLNTTATTFPNCVTGLLTSSTLGGSAVDFVVGDFNHNATGTYYARPYRFSGTGGATVEWDNGADQLVVNAPWTQRTTNSNDVVEVWDVFMEAGKFYYPNVINYSSADLRLVIFQSPSATYWTNRNGATYVSPVIPQNSSISVSWPSNASDWYGFAIINENGGTGNYVLDVTTCNPPTALANNTSLGVQSSGRQASFAQAGTDFAAVGVRPDNLAEDWAIRAHAGPYDVTYGNCLQNPLSFAINSPGKTHYVVGDFNSGANATGTYYAHALPLSGAPGSAKVEWSTNPVPLTVDAAPLALTTNSSDVVNSWDVQLLAGQTYRVHFEKSNGGADLKAAIFRNPGAGYWVTRSDALEEHGSSFYFVAPATDFYGIVVANDNGSPANYQLGVGWCRTPVALNEANKWLVQPAFGLARFEWVIPQPAWSAVGLRSWQSVSDNWDLELLAEGSGGTPPTCFNGLLATSALPANNVDLVVGDLHAAAGDQHFYVRGNFSGGATAYGLFEVDQGDTALIVDDPAVEVLVDSTDVVKAWDVYLTGGTTYDVFFEEEGGTDGQLLLFRNPGSGGVEGYWTDKTTAALVATGAPSTTSYLAPTTGWYGLVATNENGGQGLNRVGVFTSTVAVDGAVPATTRLEGITPNPAFSTSRIRYALHAPAAVDFEILDAAGRRVARIAAGDRPAGQGVATWTGAADDGRRLGAGVYFLRMLVDGRAQAESKLVLLR
jgi:hypothetical protein